MSHTDIKPQNWISKLPISWKPYVILMRLDRPIGWWLLLLPGWWGIVLGANGVQGMLSSDIRLMFFFFIGAVLMRGAGCIINDLWDRNLDKQVERTKTRPLANEDISIFSAIILLIYLLFTAFIILLMTSGVTILLGIFSLLFVSIYPFMKRITWWPQAFLGLTFNFSALMGWGAATHYLGLEAFTLYAAGFFWTLGYDTIYAHQDKIDDGLIGIKSTALLFNSHSKLWVGLFYMATIALLCMTSLLAESGIITLSLLILPALHLFYQIKEWEIDDPISSLLVFQSNRNFGLLVLFALAFTKALPKLNEIFSGISPHINSLTFALQ